MNIVKKMVHCTKCRHEWLANTVTHAPVNVVTASWKALYCPKCHSNWRKIVFGRGAVPTPEPAQSGAMHDLQKRSRWLDLHDNGLSSECIAAQMCGIRRPLQTAHPSDGDDFGRCERLLALYPEWRARLAEMEQVSEYWGALVPRWADIVVEWQHDAILAARKVKSGWRCYPLMRAILDPIERADHRVVRLGDGVTMRFGA